MAERKRMHTCTVCGKTDVWGPTWMYFHAGRGDTRYADAEIKIKVCSEECRKKSPEPDAPILD